MSASEKPLGDAAALPLGPSLRLVIVSASAFASYELPSRGDVTIGRSEKSDLRIDDATITRRHAILRVGDCIEIEDLGSVNGTRVREQRLRPGQRAQIFVGDTFHLGSALVMVQAAHPPTSERGAADDIVTRRAELAGDSARRRVEHDPPIIQDPSMRELYAYVDRLALGAIAVLVVGETGVGKELVAERLHESSPRRGKPFLRLNCAAFAESLLESELFGYERGAFTGAQQAKAGLLESADGGTVLLDEVGEMSLSVQAKLLRVLEAKQTTRVGALLARSVDVRIVAATNRSLSDDIEAGRFRRDLYFRLNGAVVTVPPLRERAGDIEPLAREFMARACRDLARPIPTLSEAALQLLMRHLWPGNVRELRNLIERAVLVASGPELLPEHFPIGQMAAALPVHRWDERPSAAGAGDDAERARILSVLSECGGNQSRAAKVLGIARSTLVLRLESYGVPRPRKA